MTRFAKIFKNIAIASVVGGSVFVAFKAYDPLHQGYSFDNLRSMLPMAVSEIEIASDYRFGQKILSGDEDALATFFAAPEVFNPHIEYMVSHVLFEKGRLDDAAFWFYLAQLRTRADAMKMEDETSHTTAFVLNWVFGSQINAYALNDPDKLKDIIQKVYEYDKVNPRKWDVRWVARFSDSVSLDKTPLTKPEQEFESIHRGYAETYLANFMKIIPAVSLYNKGELASDELLKITSSL